MQIKILILQSSEINRNKISILSKICQKQRKIRELNIVSLNKKDLKHINN